MLGKVLNYRRWVIAIALFSVIFMPIESIAGKDMPWKSQVFERTSFDENIKNVLSSLIKQNGLQVIFGEGLDASITYEFADIPLEAAFNKLIIENGLDYDFDEASGIITVSKQGAVSAVSRAFIPLENVQPGDVMGAVRRFNLEGKISIDRAARTAFIEGTPSQVSTFQGLVQRMDAASGVRRIVGVKTRQAQITKDKSAARRKFVRQLLDRKVKVFKLRYANVGSTSTTFHGRSVSVPGIEDTLKSLLGNVEEIAKKVEKQGSDSLKTALARRGPGLGASLSVSADPRTNSIIARGTVEDLARVGKVLKELDRQVPMIELDIVIVKAERNMSKTLGVNWGFEKTVTGTGSGLIDGNRVFGLNTGITSADPSAVTSGLDGAATSAAGAIGSSNIVAGIVRQFSGAALQVQLNALESDNKTQTIASPSVVTLNNVEARIERRTSSFLLSGSNDTASFEEIDVGLKLAITPMVIPREDAAELELVRLGISLDNTALAAGTGNVVGTASGQTVQTEIIMPTGRTYMIGGLMDDARTKTVQGVPGLKDLPLIGGLFQTDTNTDNFDETIFFITARVVYPQDIVARDVAERRYLRGRQLSLAGTRLDVQSNSATLENRIAFQEDDE